MPFDTMAMAAVADEIVGVATGAQIQRIIQPGEASIALSLYGGGAQRWLVLSADARHGRVGFTIERLAKAFATPSSFVMLLRKHLEGVRIVDVHQTRWERVLTLSCGPQDHRVRLIAEVMGKHSNVILIDQDDRILGALKIVPPRLSRVRPILPGHQYRPPPSRELDSALFAPGPRPDPLTQSEALRAHLQGIPTVPVEVALLGTLPGCSPFLAGQIRAQTAASPNALITDVATARLDAAIAQVYRLFDSREWKPSVFTDARGRMDFAPYLPLQVDNIESADSMSSAIDRCHGGGEIHDALSVSRREVESAIERALGAAERRVASLLKGLRASGEAESVKTRGQLLLAYQHAAQPRATELIIPDLGITIPLDPTLTVGENAERLFRRYRKLRDASRRVPILLSGAEAEKSRLQELAVFIGLADSEGSLRDLQREIAPSSANTAKPKAGKAGKRGPMRYRQGNVLLMVGRNARENEELTFRMAQRDDLWLHARARTGAHALLRGPGGEITESIVESAAAVAAFFSEGRKDTRVDVDVAAVRDVRKVPGGPAGKVTYRNAETVRVEPGLGEWEPVSAARSSK